MPYQPRSKPKPLKTRQAEAGAIMDKLKCSPVEKLCLVVLRKVPCGTCIDSAGKPTGKTKYKLPDGQHAHDCAKITAPLGKNPMCSCEGIGVRTCLSCFGTLWERIGLDQVIKAADALCRYKHPQLKALEHLGEDGGPIQHQVIVEYVGSGDGGARESSPSVPD